MKNEFWLNKWKSDDILFHQEEVNSNLILYFSKLHLQKNDHILVPLCGKSKDMLWLSEQGLQVIGVELSPIACNDFFSELGVKPIIRNHNAFKIYQYNTIKVICGDFFALSAEDLPLIQAVYDCKALIALPLELRKKYVKHLISCIGDQVKILLVTIDTNNTVKSPPFPVNDAEINLLFSDRFDIQKIKHKSVNIIAENLIQKGFIEIIECVYFIF